MFQQIVLIDTKNKNAFASGNFAFLDTYKDINLLSVAIKKTSNNPPSFHRWSSNVEDGYLDYQIVTGLTKDSALENAKEYMVKKGLTVMSSNGTVAAEL